MGQNKHDRGECPAPGELHHWVTSCFGDHLEALTAVPCKSLLCFLGRSLRWAYLGISVSWGTREAERCLKADEPNSGFGNPPKGSCIQFFIFRVDIYFVSFLVCYPLAKNSLMWRKHPNMMVMETGYALGLGLMKSSNSLAWEKWRTEEAAFSLQPHHWINSIWSPEISSFKFFFLYIRNSSWDT